MYKRQVLHRLEGEPAVDTVADFSDVKATEYYAKPVNWAAANKIVGCLLYTSRCV